MRKYVVKDTAAGELIPDPFVGSTSATCLWNRPESNTRPWKFTNVYHHRCTMVIKLEDNAALTDHFADSFVHENFALVFDVVLT